MEFRSKLKNRVTIMCGRLARPGRGRSAEMWKWGYSCFPVAAPVPAPVQAPQSKHHSPCSLDKLVAIRPHFVRTCSKCQHGLSADKPGVVFCQRRISLGGRCKSWLHSNGGRCGFGFVRPATATHGVHSYDTYHTCAWESRRGMLR